MKLKQTTKKALVKVAEYSASAASVWMSYQPKEPKVLKDNEE